MARGKRQLTNGYPPLTAASSKTFSKSRAATLPQSSPKRKSILQEIYNEDPKAALQVVSQCLRHTLKELSKCKALPDHHKSIFINCLNKMDFYLPNSADQHLVDAFYDAYKLVSASSLSIAERFSEPKFLIHLVSLHFHIALCNFSETAIDIAYFENTDSESCKRLDIALQQTALALGCVVLCQEYPAKKIAASLAGLEELLDLESKEASKSMRTEIRWQIQSLQAKLKAIAAYKQPFKPMRRKRISPLAD